ncbi:unnamed protein product [Fraxinus pennsylvanica]|uniref:Uncharacterized protein n=1 Tax=Fraxinus pennsylvanica TaxID=56036 RepID=A0AAD2DWF7_9LAMI|nr:unnamed protein product [Fraxinus pennsylvanica]
MKKSCKKLEDKLKKVDVELSSEVGYSSTPRKKNVSRKTNVDLKERRPAKSQYSKKRKNKNSQCNPKNSPSFSVFYEAQHYQMQTVATPSASEVLPVLQFSNKPIPHSKNGELKAITDEHDHHKTTKEESSYNIKLVENVYNLTEDDLKESCWVPSRVLKFEDFEEICVHHGQQIFELLLNQVVDELVLLHRRKKFLSHAC